QEHSLNATESSGHGSVPGRIATGRLRRAIPLPMLMGGVVVFCMLVVAATLMWQGATAARYMLLSAASGDARDMAVIINEKAQRALGPAEATLRQLAFDPIGGAESLDELELATQFKPPDGALFLVQSVRRGLLREPRGE